MAGDGEEDTVDSPTASQKTVSDDDVIDYSIKPEFYDPDLDDKDELWVQKRRKGRNSDAVLSCPACFTTVCLESQRHEIYVTQYRAIFVVNCKIRSGPVNCKIKGGQLSPKRGPKRKRGKRGRQSSEEQAGLVEGGTIKPVCCSVCLTEIGVIDEDEVYHFYNVLPSES